MQGRFHQWLGCGLAALLFVAAPAVGGDNQLPNMLPDPGYANQGNPGQFVSNNMSATTFEARIAALEAALAEKDKEEVKWESVHGQKWSGKVGGRIMGDSILYPNVDPDIVAVDPGDMAQNYFEFRRLRIFLSGTGYGVYDYKFQLDWEKGAAVLKDMYVGIHEIPLLGYVRFGHFKGPSGLEQLTSSKYITFMERALPVDSFTMDRRVGVAAFKNSAHDTFHINYGAFFESVDPETMDRVDDNQGIRLGARGVWTPIYTANGRGALHLGASFQYVDDADDSVQFRNRPEVHQNNRWVDTGAYDARDYGILGLEMASVYGPFSLQSELFYTDVNGTNGNADMDLYGAYVYGSWFLTGEARNYENDEKVFGRVKPHTNFWIVPTCDGPCAGWGAWELAARWSYVDYTDPALAGVGSAGQLSDMTLGINWYWNPYTRVMFEYIHPWLNRNDIGANEADILGMRMQVDF